MTKITVVVDNLDLLAVYADDNVNIRFVNKNTGSVVEVDEDHILTEAEQFTETKSLIK